MSFGGVASDWWAASEWWAEAQLLLLFLKLNKRQHFIKLDYYITRHYIAQVQSKATFSNHAIALLILGGENESVKLAAQEVPLLLQIFDAFLKPGVFFQRNLQLCSEAGNQKVWTARRNLT